MRLLGRRIDSTVDHSRCDAPSLRHRPPASRVCKLTPVVRPQREWDSGEVSLGGTTSTLKSGAPQERGDGGHESMPHRAGSLSPVVGRPHHTHKTREPTQTSLASLGHLVRTITTQNVRYGPVRHIFDAPKPTVSRGHVLNQPASALPGPHLPAPGVRTSRSSSGCWRVAAPCVLAPRCPSHAVAASRTCASRCGA